MWQMTKGPRGQRTAAGFWPWEPGLVHQAHSRSPLSQRTGRRGPRRAGTDDNHVKVRHQALHDPQTVQSFVGCHVLGIYMRKRLLSTRGASQQKHDPGGNATGVSLESHATDR